jgi:3-phenylpropionate/cinnamic acid dioxygenase small subunit
MTAEAGNDRHSEAVSEETRRDVESFLCREAELLDTWRIEEWLQLFTEDCCYWVPAGADDYDPVREISLICDDYATLQDRVLRLLHPAAYTQNPRSRTRRLISNLRIGQRSEQELSVLSNFMVLEARLDRERVVGGEYEHTLRRESGRWRIALKKVTLVNNSVPLSNLTFLL